MGLLTYEQAMHKARREYLLALMNATGGNITKAARIAGTHRTYMYALLESSQIREPSGRRRAKILRGIAASRKTP